MRTLVTAVTCLLVLAMATPAAGARLQVINPAGTVEGVCTLVDVDAGERQTTLYFVTSAQPFRTMDGEPYRSPAQRILITLDDDEVIAVPREGVLLPLGSLVDVAILRVDVTMARPTRYAISFDAPSTGTKFEVGGRDENGLGVAVMEVVRFTSTRYIVGDRDLAGLAHCIGSPALVEGSLFGIVSACETHNAPLITLLSPAFAFFERHLPSMRARPTLK